MARGGFYHAALCDERGQELADIAGTHAHDITDLFPGEAFPASARTSSMRSRQDGWTRAGASLLLIDDLQRRRFFPEARAATASPLGR